METCGLTQKRDSLHVAQIQYASTVGIWLLIVVVNYKFTTMKKLKTKTCIALFHFLKE